MFCGRSCQTTRLSVFIDQQTPRYQSTQARYFAFCSAITLNCLPSPPSLSRPAPFLPPNPVPCQTAPKAQRAARCGNNIFSRSWLAVARSCPDNCLRQPSCSPSLLLRLGLASSVLSAKQELSPRRLLSEAVRGTLGSIDIVCPRLALPRRRKNRKKNRETKHQQTPPKTLGMVEAKNIRFSCSLLPRCTSFPHDEQETTFPVFPAGICLSAACALSSAQELTTQSVSSLPSLFYFHFTKQREKNEFLFGQG